MTVIRIPKTPASAMNPNRPISGLLKNQIEHMQRCRIPPSGARPDEHYNQQDQKPREAAEYIREVTARLHPEEPLEES